MAVSDLTGSDHDSATRERALARLRKRRDFHGHLVVYALVNTVLIVIWAVINVHGFFWPIFPILGWGVGVALNAWDVYRTDAPTEEQIRKEMDRLERRT